MNMQISSLTAATALPAPVVLAGDREPIINLIEAYNAGKAAYEALPAEALGTEDECDRACDRTWRPYFEVLDSRPPQILTIQGAVAAMHYVQDEGGDELDGYNVGAVVRRVVEFLESAAGSKGAQVVHSDATLIALGAEIEERRLAEKAYFAAHTEDSDDVDAVLARGHVLVDQIESMPVNTLAGLRAKVRAIGWCRSSGEFVSQPHDARDTRLINQICAFLIGQEATVPAIDPVFAAIRDVVDAETAIRNDPLPTAPDALVDEYDRKIWALAETKPTTQEGRKALLEKMFEIERPNAWDRECPMVQTLIRIVNADYGLSLEA